MPWITEQAAELSWDRLEALMDQTVAEARRRICATPKRVLLLPPDITRMHSGAGRLTEMLYKLLTGEAEVHVIPTLGQHVPHTPEENRQMFGSIPNERIHAHDWRGGVVPVGEVLGRLCEGRYQRCGRLGDSDLAQHDADDRAVGPGDQRRPRRAARSARLRQPQQELLHRPGRQGADLRGPHGGRQLRNREQPGQPDHAGAGLLQQGRGRLSRAVCRICTCRSCWPATKTTSWFTPACTSATTWKPISPRPGSRATRTSPCSTSRSKKIVCVMQGDEFFSTWVANKAIYRTRMALADGGELMVIAPGLKRFGEQPEVDAFIRKYGYVGTPRVMEAYPPEPRHAGPGPRHGPPDSRLERRPLQHHLRPRAPDAARNRRRELRVSSTSTRPSPAIGPTSASKAGTPRPTANDSISSPHLRPACGPAARG